MAARCAYCSSELKPNSMYCNSCGQLAAQPASVPARPAASRPASPSPQIAQPPRDVTLPPSALHAYSLPPTQLPPIVEQQPSLTRFEIKLSTGEHYEIVGTALLGRKPEASAGIEALPIADDTRSVSRAHVRLRVGDGLLYVTDLGSANGTSLSRGGVLTPCLPNREVATQAGDVVWIGDISFRVLLGGP